MFMPVYDQKEFSIDFFSGMVGSDADGGVDIFSTFSEICDLEERPSYHLGSFEYQLRSMSKAGGTIKGVLAKFRTSDLPHAGSPAGEERELELEAQEGLIEKNHFLVKKDKCVVVFQRNGHAARIGRLSEYISSYLGETVIFNPILQPDAVERMLDDNLEPVTIELSYAPPTNPDYFPEDDWGERFAKLADLGNSSRIRVNLSADRRSADRDKHTLWPGLKKAAESIVKTRNASVARVKLTDGEHDYPIDLIADRLTDTQLVEMRGRYPVLDSMFAALANSYGSLRDDINEIFGQPDRRVS
ncbi:hypothetical protein Csal_1404 [Chromohalobacter israelensis DSM 3043]|uniref:Uncharacterized protein n=2 Tax=Chromohalobacter israelensis TaxID=141390 RepID=Q1QXP9_CHRI1|nr:hypothetical protein Csal_1404 [Chromohalobacter salexigens DSM 3043]